MNLKTPNFLPAIFVIAISLNAFLPNAFSEEEKVLDVQVYLTKKQAFEIAFPGADKVEREKKWLTEEQKKVISELCLQKIDANRINFYVGRKGDNILGYAVFDHEIGKSFPITFMTVLNVDGTVRDVEILVYREPRGWEVRYPSFMDQFTGRDAESDYRTVNSITGATLSVRALRKGVSRATAFYKVLYLNQ
ncbi:MAG: FMN-binding protein [Nitrospina sp.]|jgi:Na+-translocating ferredoxin:NAD+ oxidoreductase RnfG subunit|nr:FMN-binding protein [Nitrospina sp.]MBT6716047.1 FMN-binding protein [Nitrospina sp.]